MLTKQLLILIHTDKQGKPYTDKHGKPLRFDVIPSSVNSKFLEDQRLARSKIQKKITKRLRDILVLCFSI
jgi:hypothetical protein